VIDEDDLGRTEQPLRDRWIERAIESVPGATAAAVDRMVLGCHRLVVTSVFGEHVQAASDATSADWIASLLHPFGSDVGAIVPPGFDTYLRVSDAAPGDGAVWGMSPGVLAAVASTAGAHTSTPDKAWFAICDGHSWLSTRTVCSRNGTSWNPVAAWRWRRTIRDQQGRDDRHRQELAGELGQIPQLHLPHRSYYLLTGAVSAAARILEPWSLQRSQAPDMWWPDDRAWFVATDTDLSWLYVGGPKDLINDLSAALPDRATAVAITDPIA
jgi:hypothetical protein